MPIIIAPVILYPIISLAAWLFIRALVKKLNGKRFAVLGEKGVGKTVLIKFLTEGVFTRKYDPTILEEKTKKNVLKLKDLKFVIKESKDVGGLQGNWGLWRNIFLHSDIILYLFNVNKFLSKKNIKRMKQDINHIEKWKGNSEGKEKKILLIGTFVDKIPRISMDSDRVMANLRQKLLQTEVMDECIMKLGGGGKVKLIIGSMVDKASTMKLVHLLLKQLMV